MAQEFINPPHRRRVPGMTQVVRSTGGTTLYLSGQGGYDDAGQIVGPGDHYLQSAQAFRNLTALLQAVGASFRDVVKATYYLVGLDPDALDGFTRAMREAPGYCPDEQPAATLIGVEALAYEEMLVELDVIAVVDCARTDVAQAITPDRKESL